MSLEENKRISSKYHELDPNDVDEILTKDFIGHQPLGTWNREEHRQFVSNDLTDTIHEQFGEGDLVSTRFSRVGTYEAGPLKIDVLQTKRFVDGQIAEIWEFWDSKQLPG